MFFTFSLLKVKLSSCTKAKEEWLCPKSKGRHGKSWQGGIGNLGKARNPRDGQIPGKAKSPGLQNPGDGKILGMAKSPGG